MNPSFQPSFLDYPEDLKEVKNIYLKTDLGILDILSELPPIGDFEQIKKQAISIKIYGYDCKVISIDDLIRIKEIMPRAKDKEALKHLKIIKSQK